MSTLIRVLCGLGLMALGYYVGREVGRLEPIRDELFRSRRKRKMGEIYDADDPDLRGKAGAT